MKKIIISSIAIIAFIIYAIFYQKSQGTTGSVPEGTGKSATPQVSTQTSGSLTSSYKDGEYTGNPADAYYGTIQVKAIIKGGKLTDVQFLKYPNDQQESIEINSNAMPVLTQEAIQAQSAKVDIVSRATDSSNAFKESLASALAQAK